MLEVKLVIGGYNSLYYCSTARQTPCRLLQHDEDRASLKSFSHFFIANAALAKNGIVTARENVYSLSEPLHLTPWGLNLLIKKWAGERQILFWWQRFFQLFHQSIIHSNIWPCRSLRWPITKESSPSFLSGSFRSIVWAATLSADRHSAFYAVAAFCCSLYGAFSRPTGGSDDDATSRGLR